MKLLLLTLWKAWFAMVIYYFINVDRFSRLASWNSAQLKMAYAMNGVFEIDKVHFYDESLGMASETMLFFCWFFCFWFAGKWKCFPLLLLRSVTCVGHLLERKCSSEAFLSSVLHFDSDPTQNFALLEHSEWVICTQSPGGFWLVSRDLSKCSKWWRTIDRLIVCEHALVRGASSPWIRFRSDFRFVYFGGFSSWACSSSSVLLFRPLFISFRFISHILQFVLFEFY